ncbi:hypothetical protein P7K49_028189 [Saguinus oedipus]|uniref:Uncharacterized protein n=1 Tax=Saguinus oedipus TaxID=9490 RepID=A0ABQ9UBL8_SAGOE|nr:hypothetical protein P7K49_028189 [Saguinus oedipus]
MATDEDSFLGETKGRISQLQSMATLVPGAGISMEAMSENKMTPSEFSTGPVEKATKPLPFKDPNFVVSIKALWPRWRGSWQEEQNLEEPETNPRFRKGIAVATERS